MLAKTMRLPTSSQRIWMRNPSRATTIIMPGGSSNSAWILGTMSTMNDKTSEAGLCSYDKTSEAGLRSYDKTSEAGLRSYGSEGVSGRLLFGVIGGAHHRAAGNVAESQRARGLGEPVEFLRRHEAQHRQVMPARLQILADGEQFATVIAQVAHHFQNFLIGFAEAHHQAGFGRHAGVPSREAAQQKRPPGIPTKSGLMVG